MFQATWVQVDIFLDIRQTVVYRDHAQPNGSYADWATDFKNKTGYKHSVSLGYFITGMVVWFLTPLILALFASMRMKEPLALLKDFLGDKLDLDCIQNCLPKYLKVLLTVLLFLFELLCAAAYIYLLIPFASFKRAFKIIMRHEFEENEKSC